MNFSRGFSWNLGCTGIVTVLGMANQSLLARGLGPEGRGKLGLLTTIVMLGALLLGEWLSRGNTYVVGREDVGEKALYNTLIYGLVLGAFLGLVALAGSGIYPHLSQLQFYLVAALTVATIMQKAGQAILLGEDRLKLYSLLPAALIFCYLAGNLMVLKVWRLGLVGVLGAWLLASVLVLFGTLVVLQKHGRISGGFDTSIFRRTALVGGRGAVSAVLIFLLFRSDIFLVNYFLGPEILGVYMIAVIFAEMIQRLPNIAGLVLLPKVIRGQDEEDRLSLQVARNVLIFSLASAGVIVFLGKPIIEIFAGSDYIGAYVPLMWMLPGLIFSGFGSVLNTKLAGKGYPSVTIWAPALAFVMNLVLNLALIPSMGLRGAALSTSIAYGFWSVVATIFYLQFTNLRWGDILNLLPSDKTTGS